MQHMMTDTASQICCTASAVITICYVACIAALMLSLLGLPFTMLQAGSATAIFGLACATSLMQACLSLTG